LVQFLSDPLVMSGKRALIAGGDFKVSVESDVFG
jgi:hypothetical protein